MVGTIIMSRRMKVLAQPIVSIKYITSLWIYFLHDFNLSFLLTLLTFAHLYTNVSRSFVLFAHSLHNVIEPRISKTLVM